MVTPDIVSDPPSSPTPSEVKDFADTLLRRLFETIRAEGLALKHPGDVQLIYVSRPFWDEASPSRWVAKPREGRFAAGVVGMVLGLEILVDPWLPPEMFRVSNRIFRIPAV